MTLIKLIKVFKMYKKASRKKKLNCLQLKDRAVIIHKREKQKR
jgi:hypothetical protein